MASTKYSDAIKIRQARSAFNITDETAGEWANFIPNEQFNEVLEKAISAVRNNDMDLHKSLWIQGAYGSGKSHAASVIKHVMCDPVEEIQQWVDIEYGDPKYNLLRQSLYDVRKNKRLFPINLYGMNPMAHRDDLSLILQTEIKKALKAAGIEFDVKTDYDNYIQHIEANPEFWNILIQGNAELRSYAPNTKKLIQELKSADTAMLRHVKNALREGKYEIRLDKENICRWFFEVQDQLASMGTYNGFLVLWDEFTEVLSSEIGVSVLVGLQQIAEEAMNAHNNSYFLFISHPSALDRLKKEEQDKTKGRYHFFFYNMEPVSAFKIMSRKFIHDNNPDNQAYYAYHNMTMNYFRQMDEVYRLYSKASNNREETKEDLQSLFPVHPGTANLATYYAREAGAHSRSVFEFLGSNPAIREFLDSEEHFSNGDMITADYLWDFVQKVFEENVTKYGAVMERYNSYHLQVEHQGAHYLAVFKSVLLLNALNNIANNETVTPSEENIMNLFAGTPIDSNLSDILAWLNESSIIQRSPAGLYEIRFSALPMQEITDIQEELRRGSFKYTYQVANFGETLKASFTQKMANIFRPFSFGLYSEDTNDPTLLSKIENARGKAYPYEIYLALMMARNSSEMNRLKEIAERASKEERFKYVAFLVFDIPFGDVDYDRFIEYQANAQCAQKHGFADQQKTYATNASDMLKEWFKNICRGVFNLYLDGTTSTFATNNIATTINNSVAPLIFPQGPESLDLIRSRSSKTYWAKVSAKQAVDNVLSFNTKSDIVEHCKGQMMHITQLLQDSVDENLQFKDDVEPNHPLYIVAKYVEARIKHADKSSTFNLADKFIELTRPPYGLYPSYAGMGMLAFAMRPYVSKIFDLTGKPRKEQHIVEDIVEVFKIWDGGGNRNKVEFKFETKEEGIISKKFIALFQLSKLKAYSDVSSLTDARWAIRDGFLKEVGYPLWSLKYYWKLELEHNGPQLMQLIDNIIKICSVDSGIKDPKLMGDTAELLKENEFEFRNLLIVNDKQNLFRDGFQSFMKKDEKVAIKDEEVQGAFAYLLQHMENSVGFWTEEAVRNCLKDWRIDQSKPEPTPVPVPSTPTVPLNNPTPVIKRLEKTYKAKEKVDGISSLDDAKNLLRSLIDLGYDEIIDFINKKQ